MNLDRKTTARGWAGTGAIWHAAMCLTVLCMGSVAAAAGVEDVAGDVATDESVAESSGELSGDAYDDDLVLVPVTKKPAETRMGKGKGAPEYWVAPVKPGRILYEMEGVPEETAREAMRLAAQKLPVRTKFVARMEARTAP